MQATHQLGPEVPDVLVPFGQQSQYCGVVGGLDRPEPWGAEGGNGHRASVVGVVLVRLARPEHPHPRGKGGRHVEHVLAGIDELLAQQVAESSGRLDGPGALLERRRPPEQPVDLLSSGPDGDGGQFSLIASNGHGGVGRLVRVDSDDDGHEYLLVCLLGTARALLIQIAVHFPLSSHSAARSRRGALRSKAKQHQSPAGTRRANPARGSSKRYESPAASATSLNQARVAQGVSKPRIMAPVSKVERQRWMAKVRADPKGALEADLVVAVIGLDLWRPHKRCRLPPGGGEHNNPPPPG